MTRGGARPGAGRRKGKVGEAKRELAEMAKEHAEAALLTLIEIATGDGAPSARVSAAVAILDRAFGKPPQALEHSALGGSLEGLAKRLLGTAIRPKEADGPNIRPDCARGTEGHSKDDEQCRAIVHR